MTKTVNISTFKAHCLSMLDEIHRSGEELLVTKRGDAIAKVTAIEPPSSLRGSVSYKKELDLTAPTADNWEAEN